jgi:TolB-like protein
LSGGRVERRLAAILVADVVGYSRLIGEDEEGTLDALQVIRRELADPKVVEHRGRIVKTTGDGLLVEFASVVDALRCAGEVQTAMSERSAGLPLNKRIEFRIGIHQGDIVVKDGDIFGDGVNIAARLEGLAEPGGICVSARVQEDAAGRLDLSFDDLGERSLKNIARPVRVYRVRPDRAPLTTSAPALTLPDKPSIAVLPFQNLSGDPEQEYFADGMVEEIITALSKIHWLFVIARNSTVTYKGQILGAKEIGRDLAVRYVLEGSVRKSGNRVRIIAQLIDAGTGAHLWADRFDGLLEDVFDLQDQIATNVAGIIEPALQAAEIRRSAARPTTDLTAYDLYLRALAVYFPITKERTFAALELLDRAIEIDPNYGPALSWAAVCHWQCVTDGWTEQAEITRSEAIDQARRALEATQNDPGVLANVSFILANFGEDIGAMIGLVDRALALNPSFARGWNVSGLLRLYAGELDRAIEHVETALRLSPRERIGTPLVVIGLAYFFQRRFDQALVKLLLAIQENPGSPATYRILTACYAHMGRMAEAREAIAQLRAITPLVMPSTLPWRIPEHRELLLSGLHLAGGEGN